MIKVQTTADCGVPNPNRYIYNAGPILYVRLLYYKKVTGDGSGRLQEPEDPAVCLRLCFLSMAGKLHTGNSNNMVASTRQKTTRAIGMVWGLTSKRISLLQR